MGQPSENRLWHMLNIDTEVQLDGQFDPGDVTESVSASYAETHTLNRQTPISQFLHGDSDTLTFQARLFAGDSSQSILPALDTLKAWTRRDPNLSRPPHILFWVGDGSLRMVQSVIESLGSIRYDRHRSDGSIRGVTMTVSLREVVDFSLISVPPPETRFHKVRADEYQEFLAAREYSEPLLGDVVRKRQPRLDILQPGDTFELPSRDAIRNIAVVPRSVALRNTTSRKQSLERTNREFHFNRTNREVLSTIIPEGL